LVNNKSTVEIYNDELRSGTLIIAEGFGKSHFRLLRIITKHEERFRRLDKNRNLISRRVQTKKTGRPVHEIMLNKKQAIFLGSLLKNVEIVLNFKERLADDFVDNERALLALASQRQSKEWIENRAAGKLVRKDETDTVKDYVEYAKAQGSQNADKYYMIITSCLNNELFDWNGKFKNKREMMSPDDLRFVSVAEKIVKKTLVKGMAEGLPYKECYQLVKKNMIALADMHGKQSIVSKLIDDK
jgi:phage regulator Rha-like protein